MWFMTMIRMKFPAILQKLGDEDPDFAFNLFNLVRQLKRLLTGEKLNDSIGVEHVTRVNLRSSVKSHFFSLSWSDHHRAGLEERYGWEVPEKM